MDNLNLTPKNINKLIGVKFVLNGDTVTGFKAGWEVNYGTMGLPMEQDIWSELTAEEKTALQGIYDKCLGIGVAKVTEAINAAK